MKSEKRRRGFRPLCAGIIAALLIAVAFPASLTPVHAAGAGQAVIAVAQSFSDPDSSAPSGVFSYRLTRNSPAYPLPAGSSAEAYSFTLTGTVETGLPPLTFTAPGAYIYELAHTTAARPGYTYDTVTYRIYIYVRSNLAVSMIVRGPGGSKASGINFSHSYTPAPPLPSEPGLMWDPPVVKTVTGRPAVDSSFSFRLRARIASSPMPPGSAGGVKTVSVRGSGRANFGTWRYTEAGTYYYTVSEINDGVWGYRYDTTVYTIKDEVKASDGTLVVARVVTNSAGRSVTSFAFRNVYGTSGGGSDGTSGGTSGGNGGSDGGGAERDGETVPVVRAYPNPGIEITPGWGILDPGFGDPGPGNGGTNGQPGGTNRIDEGDVPLAGGGTWSLFDLLCALLAAIVFIAGLLWLLVRRSEDEEDEEYRSAERHGVPGYSYTAFDKNDESEREEDVMRRRTRPLLLLISLLAAVANSILFIYTQALWLRMIFFDRWSFLFATILIIGVVFMRLTFRRERMEREADSAARG
ncbi:MAG: hypothetical protein LBC58_05565 [Clostridiales Family XIII bacterium]|nr:hypothetical protein [Clostridiales Family XIII bacterium]